MTPHTKSLDELIAYAETQVKAFRLPPELTKNHVYIRVLSQKLQAGKVSRFNNTNPVVVVYEILETSDFLARNKHRLEYIRSYHQLRLFGHEVWIQSFQAKTEPVNIEREMKIEVATCRRMITKITNAITTIENQKKNTLFPDPDDIEAYQKLNIKLMKYNERLSAAITNLETFQQNMD